MIASKFKDITLTEQRKLSTTMKRRDLAIKKVRSDADLLATQMTHLKRELVHREKTTKSNGEKVAYFLKFVFLRYFLLNQSHTKGQNITFVL